MPKGLLEISGTIDLAQFWPAGESDGDTIKLLLSGNDAFRFTPYPGAPSKVTRAFINARIKGKVNKPAIDNKNRITIRLQGIDAPELHYMPTAPTLNGKKPKTARNRPLRSVRSSTLGMAISDRSLVKPPLFLWALFLQTLATVQSHR